VKNIKTAKRHMLFSRLFCAMNKYNQMENQNNKWGINLELVLCPECGSKQPALRIPENFEQFVNGGWTCESCQCKMDKNGNKITK